LSLVSLGAISIVVENFYNSAIRVMVVHNCFWISYYLANLALFVFFVFDKLLLEFGKCVLICIICKIHLNWSSGMRFRFESGFFLKVSCSILFGTNFMWANLISSK